MPNTGIPPIIPTEQDAVLAREAARVLGGERATLRVQVASSGRDATTVDLPDAALRLLKEVLDELAAGRAVTLVSTDTELDLEQAAELLNVSRAHVMRLIETGVLPAGMVSHQRRLSLNDVLAHKTRTEAKAFEALREMAEIDQQLGLR